MKILAHLASVLHDERDAIMNRWRKEVCALDSAKKLDAPTLSDHMPLWISELASALRTVTSETPDENLAVAIPFAHGLQRFEDGFDIEEVVSEYNIMRDCVHDLAEREGVDLVGKSRRILNRVFDDSIAAAVKAFAESQAREVQRRRAEHLAFVAHDLRTPLSAITFSVHVLEQRLPEGGGNPETARLLRILGRNAKQIDALVNHVLKENTQLLTELGVKIECRTFDLWPMVETLMQDMQLIATKSATRMVNLVPDDLEIRADAALMRRVFQNLIANAIEYTPGGEVTIGARDPGPGQPVECWVTDNGAGISRDRIGKVFEALETDPERDGLGLGLAIVKTFVEAHEGTVIVESVEGQGSTFRFTLPRSTKAPAQEKVPVPG